MEGFDDAMISNVRNNLFLAKLVAPDMVARRDGSIIIMSSIVGSRGRAGMGIYSTTKAAVNQLVRTMAVEWGPHQVRTNAIAPTVVRTDFSRFPLGSSRRVGSRNRPNPDGSGGGGGRCRRACSSACLACRFLHQRPGHQRRWRG